MNFSTFNCKNDFWFENIQALWCNTTMTTTEQLNSLTRLVIIIFLCMLIFGDFKSSFIFLILSLLFIIILYYIQKKSMTIGQTENYEYNLPGLRVNYQPNLTCLKSNTTLVPTDMKVLKQQYLTQKHSTQSKCTQDYIINPGPNFISENQQLVGKANPKTLIQPVIVAPPTDLDFWRANNLVNHSHINVESQYDEYLSGYKSSNLPNYQPDKYSPGQVLDLDLPGVNPRQNPSLEQFEYPHALPNESGWVNTQCGYNSNQIFDSNLPSNLQVGNCELTPQMKEYNKNLFTQYIQPDIFTRNEIIEPINSNIGISFTQQFPPKTSSRDENGLTYIEHDPRVFSGKSEKKMVMVSGGITESQMYDPRFTGYGTSYRAYTDKNLGQTKFYYDDVNAIRMPNYIVRSNIDFAQYADTYGPLSKENKNGNIYTNDIKALAQDSFLRSSIQQRESLSESLMRKRNAELWQLRKYPMRSFGGSSSKY